MLKKEASVFLVVGGLTVAIDFLIYTGINSIIPNEVGISKAIGFLGGTIFAYFANRFWTFGHNRHAAGSHIRFGALYCLSLLCNIGINSLALYFLGSGMKFFAFLLATGFSAATNFLGMRYFVFPNQVKTEA